jgi:glutamate synthase (NADPH/NADH) small chain
MGDPRGFLKIARGKDAYRPVAERVADFGEVVLPRDPAELRAQASRCMDCGIPFCHRGCPLANLIPEWNELVYRGRLDEAVARLLETNNFPEVTGRVCPAPCEASCVLNLQGAPVTIKAIEQSLGERARAAMAPVKAPRRTGHTSAIVGSGPAGLACAQELARKGHDVTVLERDDRVGGLLRYGIPDFKMGKAIVDARVAQMEGEGVRFRTGVHVGVDVTAQDLTGSYDAVVLCGGARKARELPVPGRELSGVHLAMDFLRQQNARCAGDTIPTDREIVATGKRVVVLGGGDTGSDCVGTAIRQKARSVTQLELLPQPPSERAPTNPWPEWPLVLRTSSSQQEGMDRDWAVSTRALVGVNGAVTGLLAVRVTLHGREIRPIEGSDVTIPCELVLLAMGFVGPEASGLLEQLGVGLDARGNVKSDKDGATSVPGVFVAGDMGRGQSLVVWAIADGRRVAAGVDAYLSCRGQRRIPRAGA